MDKTLDERCAEFFALDASRTQGEWALLPDLFPRDKTHAGVYVQKDERVFDEIGNLIRDAEFIAAASKIPALIRDLQARVKELESDQQVQFEYGLRMAIAKCERRADSVSVCAAMARQCAMDILSLLPTGATP